MLTRLCSFRPQTPSGCQCANLSTGKMCISLGERREQSEDLDLEARGMFSGSEMKRQSTDIINFIFVYKVGLMEQQTFDFTLNTSEFSFNFCFS